jgi:prolyl oligopeptidase
MRACCFALSLSLTIAATAFATDYDYPESPRIDVIETLHGIEIVDPYRWLETGTGDDIAEWTAAQNKLTRALLDQFENYRDHLRQELEQLYFVTSTSIPGRFGDKFFFSQREAAQDHAVIYVRDGSLDAEPQVVLDPNKFSEDGTVALDWWVPSPDGKLVVYGKSESGSEESTLYLRDVETATDLALEIPNTRACAIGWDPDGQGFHYTRYPEKGTVPAGDENFFRRVFYHKFGTDWRNDPMVFGDDMQRETWTSVGTSSDYRYKFFGASIDWTKNDLWIRKVGAEEMKPIAVGLDGGFGGDVLGDKLYIRTNYEAPRYRVLVMPVDNPGPDHWKTLIPEGEGVIDGMRIVGGKLVLHVLEDAYSRLKIYNLDGTLEKELELPTLGSIGGFSGEPDHPELFYRFDSFAYPDTNFVHNLKTGENRVLDRVDVDINFDQYTTEQVWYRSKDNTRVPMFIVKKKDTPRDGQRPTLLYGYGGFNNAMTPFLYRAAFDWLDRGGLFAVANIRGGGEFGKEWHLAGRMENKQNTFDDFIAAAEYLIRENYTNRDKLAVRGGSNGGLLMGAIMTQRPELFQAVVCGVPLLDMLRYHKKEIGALWIPEYGNPDDPEHFKFIYAYSPYHNVTKGTAYPATLFRTAETDTRVDPMHARKMTAMVQWATSANEPILLWVEPKAGHGAGMPLSKAIDRQLDIWTFIAWQLGVVEEDSGG